MPPFLKGLKRDFWCLPEFCSWHQSNQPTLRSTEPAVHQKSDKVTSKHQFKLSNQAQLQRPSEMVFKHQTDI